jgi:type II secretory pathway predicted ATPase ExeA
MDATHNPFAPGAGTQPPELAGRDEIIRNATVALGRVSLGRPARSQLLLGLRGVGKTVLLNRIAQLADEQKFATVVLEAPEDRTLAEMLVPPLRSLLFKLSRLEKTKEVARRALAVLRAFAGMFKVSAGDVEFGVSPETGTADSGNLEADLPEVFLAAAEAAKHADKAVALFVDEVQYLGEGDLAALIVSIHKVGQRGLPLVVFGAGLPQLAALAGEAKSYAERLFDYPDVGPLPEAAARDAIRTPLEREGVGIDDPALALIVEQTKGYPYFLQEWGAQAWNAADRSPITREDARKATSQSVAQLDRGFFRVRLDRLTPRERDYMRAMAELGAGPHRSGDIAQVLAMGVTAAGPLRNGLIKKGMIFSPQHGDTAFTVPMFDEFMRRSMPDWTSGSAVVGNRKGRKRKKSPAR